jgi:phosphoglycolate phosphatase
MIHAFAAATGLEPIEIAMVGDNSHDIETARAGGAGLAIAVLSGNAAHGDIAHLADHTLASIAELPQLLRRLG